MIKIVHLADRRNLSGSIITLFDLHFNLNYFGIKHEFCIYCDSADVSLVYYDFARRYTSNLKDDSFKISFAKKEVTIESDIIITTTELLSALFPPKGLTKKLDCKLYCDSIIMLDTLGLWIAEQDGRLNEIKKLLKTFPKINFFTSPASMNYEFFDKITEYYHKFSPIRLNYISERYKTKFDDYFTTDIYIKAKKFQTSFQQDYYNPHLYSKYNYHRWYKVNYIYAENIGKMIYEFMWLGKPVRYTTKNKMFDDGLHYYFKQIGLDDNKDFTDLILDRSIIENALFMNETDLLLNTLKG